MRQKWTCIGRNTEARNKSTERSEVQRWSRDNRIHGIHQHQESSLSRSSALLCIGLFSPTAKIFFLQWWEQIYWALFRLRFCSLPPSQHRTSFSLVWKISRECSHHPCLDQVSTPSVKHVFWVVFCVYQGFTRWREIVRTVGNYSSWIPLQPPWPVESLMAFSTIEYSSLSVADLPQPA